MTQEEIIDNTFDEINIKTEKTKKLIIIMVIVILFLGTYYYYRNMKNKVTNIDQQKVASVNINQPSVKPLVKTEKAKTEETATKTEIKKETTKEELASVKKEVPNTENTTETTNNTNIRKEIKPTDKASLVKLAMISAGKPDPFTGSGSKNIYNNGQGILPPPPLPQYVDGLPNIGNLPSLDPNSGYPPQDSLAVKGFVGNKVIVSVNGVTESLKVNETFQGVKVLKVEPKNLTAKFKRDGEEVTKTIKNLTEFKSKDSKIITKTVQKLAGLEDNSDLKMFKELNTMIRGD